MSAKKVDQIVRIRALAAVNTPAWRIAEAIGISQTYLYEYAKIHGIDVTTRRPATGRLPRREMYWKRAESEELDRAILADRKR